MSICRFTYGLGEVTQLHTFPSPQSLHKAIGNFQYFAIMYYSASCLNEP